VGAKDWLLVYADGDARAILRGGPTLDRAAARLVAERLYPDQVITPIADGTLGRNLNPEDSEIYVGAYPGLTIVCTVDVALDRPTEIPAGWVGAVPATDVYLHAMHSVVDWFAYAIWTQGVLRRSLSLSPDRGIMENIGAPLPLEKPYWAGERPVEDDESDEDDQPYPLPFHPLELGEDALAELLGFTIEGSGEPDEPDLEMLPLAGFAIT
jgi:hypothetical protein